MKDQSGEFFESTGAARLLPQLLARTDSGAIVDVNRASEAFYGWPRVTMRSMLMSDLDTEAGTPWSVHAEVAAKEGGRREQRSHRIAGGELRPVEMCTSVVHVGTEPLMHVIVHERPASAPSQGTPSRNASSDGTPPDSARDARRIVHDFNNLLTVLRGSTTFLQDAIAELPQAREDLAAIERATDRAEELINELLAVLPKKRGLGTGD